MHTPSQNETPLATVDDIKELLRNCPDFRPHIALDENNGGYNIDFLVKDCSLTCSEWYLGQILLWNTAYWLYRHTQSNEIVGFYIFSHDTSSPVYKFIKEKLNDENTLFLDDELADMILSSIEILDGYTRACNFTVQDFSQKVFQILSTYIK